MGFIGRFGDAFISVMFVITMGLVCIYGGRLVNILCILLVVSFIKSSVLVTTILYMAIIILSLCSHPEGFDFWIAYISDLDNLHGLTRYPTFYAAGSYMGNAGTVMIATSLLFLVISSLIGMMTALSRLMYAMGNDDIIPARFAELNSRGVPGNALGFIMAVSCIIPFIGRTAIGWIVDVTTIGTVLVYVFVAAAAYKVGRRENSRNMRYQWQGNPIFSLRYGEFWGLFSSGES